MEFIAFYMGERPAVQSFKPQAARRDTPHFDLSSHEQLLQQPRKYFGDGKPSHLLG